MNTQHLSAILFCSATLACAPPDLTGVSTVDFSVTVSDTIPTDASAFIGLTGDYDKLNERAIVLTVGTKEQRGNTITGHGAHVYAAYFDAVGAGNEFNARFAESAPHVAPLAKCTMPTAFMLQNRTETSRGGSDQQRTITYVASAGSSDQMRYHVYGTCAGATNVEIDPNAGSFTIDAAALEPVSGTTCDAWLTVERYRTGTVASGLEGEGRSECIQLRRLSLTSLP